MSFNLMTTEDGSLIIENNKVVVWDVNGKLFIFVIVVILLTKYAGGYGIPYKILSSIFI